MPSLYDLHQFLALGAGGALVLGVVALLWTLDCFVGFWLTLPVRGHPRRTPSAWAARWARAWRVRWPTRPFKLTFDLHSATGLWLWAALFVLAWSGVAFNLPAVYRPVTRALMGGDPPVAIRPVATAAVGGPPALEWRAAYAAGRAAMAQQARADGFRVLSERLMFYDPTSRFYAYRIRSTLDVGRLGNTQLTLDADSGRVLGLSRPTGASLGGAFTTWIENLHEAEIWRPAMQVLLCGLGVAVASLSVTGVLVWARKRQARA